MKFVSGAILMLAAAVASHAYATADSGTHRGAPEALMWISGLAGVFCLIYAFKGEREEGGKSSVDS